MICLQMVYDQDLYSDSIVTSVYFNNWRLKSGFIRFENKQFDVIAGCLTLPLKTLVIRISFLRKPICDIVFCTMTF